MVRLIRGVLGIGLVVALGIIVWSTRTAALPFYGSADFTPHWSAVSHRVGEFSLTDQRGRGFTNADVAGRVYVASFIFTRCSVVCPVLVKHLATVEAATRDTGALIVSFSVTPDLDTPSVLETFGRDRGINADRWKLLTGDKEQIFALARERYFADDERVQATKTDPNAFLHTEKLVLVDQQGRLRGVYDGTMPRDVELLISDMKALAK
jgi:protein SCO1/2